MTNNINSNILTKRLTSLINCWKITLNNGKILSFTDYDVDIEYERIIYLAKKSFIPYSILKTDNLLNNKFMIETNIDNHIVRYDDIVSGVYDDATINIFVIDANFPNDGIIRIKHGKIGKVKINNNKLLFEVTNIAENMRWSITSLFSPTCRTNFCDQKCSLNIESFQIKTKITKILNNQKIEIEHNQKDHFYSNGLLIASNNQQYKIFHQIGNILKISNKNVILNINDTVLIQPDCNKEFDTCQNKYHNAINFRGEPNIPYNMDFI